MKFNWLIILLTFSLVSFSDPYTIKRISDANFRYEFYVTEKTVTPQKKKVYYWFKGGAIHSSESGMAGNLLDGEFVKMYHSNQLAEQGKFEDGLKVGLWKTWHTNGVIETTQYWKDGYRCGDFYHYDSTGEMLEKGNYRANLKHGKWLDFVKKDTVAFKKGSVYVKKKSSRKKIKTDVPNTKKTPDATINNSEKKQDNFFKRLFSKKGAN